MRAVGSFPLGEIQPFVGISVVPVDFAKADVGRIEDVGLGAEEYAQLVDLVGTAIVLVDTETVLGGTSVGPGDREIDFADLEGMEVDLVGRQHESVGAFVVGQLGHETRADIEHLEGASTDFSDIR